MESAIRDLLGTGWDSELWGFLLMLQLNPGGVEKITSWEPINRVARMLPGGVEKIASWEPINRVARMLGNQSLRKRGNDKVE